MLFHILYDKALLISQKEVVRDLTGNDLIIVSSIAGGYWQDHPDMLREIAKSRAHKICITQVENIPYQEQFDMIIQVGTDHLSLIRALTKEIL